MLRKDLAERYDSWTRVLAGIFLAIIAFASLGYLWAPASLPGFARDSVLLMFCTGLTLATMQRWPKLGLLAGLVGLSLAVQLLWPRIVSAWDATLPAQNPQSSLLVTLGLLGTAAGLAGLLARPAAKFRSVLTLQLVLFYMAAGLLVLAACGSLRGENATNGLWLPWLPWLGLSGLTLLRIQYVHAHTRLVAIRRPRLWLDLAAATALIALAGWLLQSAAVVQAGTGSVPIQFNTAVALLCIALALRRERNSGYVTNAILLCFPLMIAAFAFLEELGWVKESVDQLLWTHRIVSEAVPPGRVSIGTAVSIVLLAVAVMVRPLTWRRPLQGLLEWGCGLMVIVIGGLSLLGYGLGLLDARVWGGHTPMALLTAVALCLLGLAVLLRGVARGRDWAGRAVALPAVVAMTVCLITARLWLTHLEQPIVSGRTDGIEQWFVFYGLSVAGLLAVALRFGLLSSASARAQERMSSELRVRNDLLRKMAGGMPREATMREILDGLSSRLPAADISIFFEDAQGSHVVGSELARRLEPVLKLPQATDSAMLSGEYATADLPAAATRAGYRRLHTATIRSADVAMHGLILVMTREPEPLSSSDVSYIRSSANVAGVALQRDAAMQQMEQSNERHRSLVENHPDAVLQLDATGTIEAANRAAYQLFDRIEETLLHMPLANLLDPASAILLTARLQSALLGNAPTLDAIAPLAHRRARELELTLVPLSAQTGKTGLFALVRDVTRYRAADRALRRTYEQTLEFRDRLIALNQVAVALARHTDMADLLQFLARQMQACFRAETVRISLDRPHLLDEPLLATASAHTGVASILDPSLLVLARRYRTPKRQTRRAADASAPAGQNLSAQTLEPKDWIGMALVVDSDEPIGTIELANKLGGEFDDDDEALLVQFAQLAAGAMVRTRLLQGLRDAQIAAARQLAFVRAMAGSIVDGLYAIDQSGRLNFMNPAAERLLACDAQRWMGELFEVRCGLKDSRGNGPGAGALLSGALVTEGNLRIRDRNGHSFPVDLLASPMKLEGETIGAVVVFRDISERQRADEARTERDKFFELSVEMFIITDITGRFLQTNRAVADLLAMPVAELAEKSWGEFVHPDDRAATEAVVEQLFMNGRLEGFVNRWVDARGESHWLEWAAAVAPDQRIFAVARDITERRNFESEIAHFSTHDSLTGLPRIEQLEAFLISALAAAAQRGGRVNVFYIDLDRFHAINDSRGRLIGDEVLRIVARRLGAAVGERGKLCRVAGDEFVLVRVDAEDGPDQQELGEVLRALIEEQVEIEQQQVFLTCSIGVSCFPENGAMSSELIRQAEAAMMRAKDEGRNSVASFSNDEIQALRDRLELGSGLRDAISADELVLHFQPQISAHNWQVDGVEALVRWQHPQRGLLLPGRFIAVAEELGVIVELGQWVLESACRRAREWLDGGLADFTIAVNVSGLQLQRPDFLDRVQRALEVSRLPPRYLELELTESMVMAHVERVIVTMRQLKALGVSISLDDFGSGYSSLSYLRRFPIDKLKIDQSFVRDITTDPGSAGICRAIIGLGHQLGMTVAAEGVETIGHAGFLRRSECDQFQGNYFSLPLPAEQAFDVLRRRYLRQEELGGTLTQSKASNTLLLLDDEENVIRALVRLLRRDGYDIVTATSADKAFELLASQPVQVIISDQRMPDISGTEFLYKVKELYPDTVRLILSGYSDFASLTDAINRGAVYRFVAKPWDDDELRRTIREAFRRVDTRLDPRVM